MRWVARPIEALKSDDSVSFTLTVTDSQGASDSETLTITLDGANDRPDAPSTNSVSMDEDNPSSSTLVGAGDRARRGASRRTEEHETPPTAHKDDDRKLRIR